MIHVTYRDEKIRYNAYHLTAAFWPGEEIDSSLVQTGARIRIFRDGATEPLAEAEDIRELYAALREQTGRDLPWGMLTGVRPTKLATQWIRRQTALEPGSSAQEPDQASQTPFREDFVRWFWEERRVSAQKAGLAYDVAMTEKSILDSLHLQPGSASLYIGIPFCPSICRYCSFSSGSISRFADRVEPYLKVLAAEMRQKKQQFFPAHSDISCPTTIYIGGGTPTALQEQQLTELLDAAEEIFGIQSGLTSGSIREYTVEAGRPDSITGEKLDILKAHGVTRISINPQSMNQKTLDAIGRNHSVEQVQDAFDLARSKGFDNINMDLIMGLSGETEEDVRNTLEQIRMMHPDSLTIHSLAVKRASAMGIERRTQANSTVEPGHESGRIETMIQSGYETALGMGMHPYYLYRQKQIAGNFENIGYAMPGREGLYNILIMEEVQSIIACGAGASNKIVTEEAVSDLHRGGRLTHIVRSENTKDIDEYIRRGMTGTD